MLLCIESNGSMSFGMEMLLVKPHVQDQSNKELVNIASNCGYGEGKALEFMQWLWFEKVRFNCKEGSKSEQNGYRNCDGVVKFTIIYPKKKNWMQEYTQRLLEWFLVWSKAVFDFLQLWKILDF